MPVLSFDEALRQIGDSQINLLIGNGFSIAQDRNRFTYRNLLEKANLLPTDPILQVFQRFNTVDFEVVIHALEHAAKVEDAYGNSAQRDLFLQDADRVRESLIDAIRAVHPQIQYDIPQGELTQCGRFVSKFTNIFTLNYDLLLYWVNLNTAPRPHSDGFGLGQTGGSFLEFSPQGICSMYNLHGGLHLFLAGDKNTLKRRSTTTTIVADIETTIRGGRLPIFVAEGSSLQKRNKIDSVPYLRHCFETLREKNEPIFIVGHSADPNDAHVYEAVFEGNSAEVYFCVFDPTNNLLQARQRMAPYNVGPNKPLYFVDSSSIPIWR